MRYGVGASGQAQLPGRASLELGLDGGITMLTGAVDIGQGSDTALGLIAAEELQQPLTAIALVTGDTALTPDAGPTTGSRIIYYAGNATKQSAAAMREALVETASGLLERPVEELELREGEVVHRNGGGGNGGGQAVSFAEIARARESERLPLRFDGEYNPADLVIEPTDGSTNPYPVYVTATHLAEVEVDTESGRVRVLRIVAAHDVGRAVFPLGLKGQIEGAVSMGLGLALKEEFIPGETTGFKQYRIPTTHDTPEVVTLLVESVDPSASLGAKGAAECATVPVAPAIVNAIADAVGVRVCDLPATARRVSELMVAAVTA